MVGDCIVDGFEIKGYNNDADEKETKCSNYSRIPNEAIMCRDFRVNLS